jgi:hypothetical protein
MTKVALEKPRKLPALGRHNGSPAFGPAGRWASGLHSAAFWAAATANSWVQPPGAVRPALSCRHHASILAFHSAR